MLDGKNIVSLNPGICAEQNRYYNGWKNSVNDKLFSLWDPYEKIIDAPVNTQYNFQDSKPSLCSKSKWINGHNS